MKCEKWIIEIDGKKFAIDRTFGGKLAIYYAGGEFIECGHYYEGKRTSQDYNYFGGKDKDDCVFILARRVI